MNGEDSLLVRVGSAEEADEGGENGPGDGGHAAGHQGHDFGAGHFGDVGFDDERGLGLPDEDVGGGGDAFGSGKFHGFAHDPGEGEHDALEDAEVIEEGGEGAEEDDGGEDLKGEDEAEGVDVGDDAAEEEFGAFFGESEDGDEEVGGVLEEVADLVDLENEEAEGKLEADASDDEAPVDGLAVYAEEHDQSEKNDDAEESATDVRGNVHNVPFQPVAGLFMITDGQEFLANQPLTLGREWVVGLVSVKQEPRGADPPQVGFQTLENRPSSVSKPWNMGAQGTQSGYVLEHEGGGDRFVSRA